MTDCKSFKLFDAHFHIIDPHFPLVENNGFLPDYFTYDDYRQRTAKYQLAGGALVSGSFQEHDQMFMIDALSKLGEGFVGVIQLPDSVSDQTILDLHKVGVRGVRFNLKRGITKHIDQIEKCARRIFDLAGWHIELYVDSSDLAPMMPFLSSLPAVSIAHFALSRAGFDDLLKLVEKGIRVKATGFGRVDFDVSYAMKKICAVNSDNLMFGTDLPSTRAKKPFTHDDFLLIIETLGEDQARKVFYDNAVKFYFPAGKID